MKKTGKWEKILEKPGKSFSLKKGAKPLITDSWIAENGKRA